MRNNNYFAVPGLVGLRELRINTVKSVVLENIGVSWEDLISENRTRPLPDARKMFAYCINKYCGTVTCTALGDLMKRDHATVLYYFKKVSDLRATDGDFRRKLEKIEFKINQYNATI